MSEQSWETDSPWEGKPGAEDGALLVAEGGVVVGDIAEPLTMDEARELTENIRSTADFLYVLLARAHAGKAWEALGYSSWGAYVGEEFHISRSRAYQILNQASVIEAIEAATPEGTEFHITESAARGLKTVMDEMLPEIERRTEGLTGDDAGEVVEEIVEQYREQQKAVREQRENDAAELAADRAERAGFSEGGGGEYRPPPLPDYSAEDDLNAVEIRRNVQAAYDLYSTMTALKAMPDVQGLIDTIPYERREQINEGLPVSLAWLQEFADTWFAQPFHTDSDDLGDGDADGDDFGEGAV
jgi:hypothetical protein